MYEGAQKVGAQRFFKDRASSPSAFTKSARISEFFFRKSVQNFTIALSSSIDSEYDCFKRRKIKVCFHERHADFQLIGLRALITVPALRL